MSEEERALNPTIWDIHSTHAGLVNSLREKLSEVMDPEIGLNVIQLGLVRKVTIVNNEAKIYILLTTPFCPYGPAMLEMIKNKAQEGLGMPVVLELGFEPWDFSLMEDPGAIDWGMYT